MYVDLQALYGIRDNSETQGEPANGLLVVAANRLFEFDSETLFLACGDSRRPVVSGRTQKTIAGAPDGCVGFIAQGALLPASTFRTSHFEGARLIAGSFRILDATCLDG